MQDNVSVSLPEVVDILDVCCSGGGANVWGYALNLEEP